jgi:amino acid adenylation domain-containing protein
LVGQLEALARSEKATLFMVLLAGWYALLRRYSGQEDILVGSPFANRTMPEVGDMVGLFMNVVVLRCDLSGGPTFRELVKRVRVTTLAAFERQAYPFEKLVEILNPTRDASRTPFYQNLFVLQTAAGSPAQIPDLEMEWRDIHTGTAKTDLTMSLEDRDGGLGGWLEYSTDLYDATTIERLMGHYRTLLENAAADPDRAITALEMLSEPERHQILTEWNATETEYPRDVLVPEAFSRQAANSPERVALTFGGSRFTYGELEARSNQVARRLQRMGVGPGALVGVHVERSPEMLVALLGVMKSGAGYVPLDPGFPPDRLNFMVEDAALRALITEESAHTPLAARIGRILIDRDWPAISKESGEGFACPAGPDDVAYVLYTSGSTGKPKGVQITHLALANFQYSMAREPGIKAEDVLLAVTTISFDIAGLELYLPLMIGASLVLTPKEATLDARVLSGLIERYSVTVMQATPATWQMLLDSGWEGNRNMRALCGGEALSRDLANGLLRRVGELWNMYGPTETTIWSLVRRIAPADRTILIGRPIANTTVYILDENQNPVPVGVTGELYIGGEGVSTGYLNRAELTAERFIPDPFKSGAGNIYKTGDLARFWSTGEVECLGRNDFQVKIRGFRIELAEIESVLKEHPAVRQCVVAACEDNRGKRLVAYLVAREGERPLSTDLRAFLAVHLPDYMVPAQFVFIDAIPVTPNGKVDRLALPGPDSTPSASAETGYAPPADDFERLVAESWAEILGVPRVGIHDNFFDLGGHSLLAVQLAVRLEEIIPGEPIPLVAVLEAPTVERMAAWLRNRTTGESRYLVRMRPPRVVRPEAGGVFPPSPLS